MENNSVFLYHSSCPTCGSNDNVAVYSDGREYCYTPSCSYRHNSKPNFEPDMSRIDIKKGCIKWQTVSMKNRGLTKSSLKKWDVGKGETFNSKSEKNEVCVVFNYKDKEGSVVAQHIKFKDKKFKWQGDFKRVGLYGMWRPITSTKKIIITEGELDAISISQAQEHKWPVVSVPNGADSAKKHLQENYEWVNQFEEIVLCFDNDDAGQRAVEECAPLFPVGKVFVVHLPVKDANDMIAAHREDELIKLIWNAIEYRPDGIVMGDELWARILNRPKKESLPYPWEELNRKTHGLRQAELTVVTAHTGVGKSLFCRQIAYDFAIQHNERVGYIALEESVEDTAMKFMGFWLDTTLHLKELEPESLHEAYKAVLEPGNFILHDHFGSLDPDNLFNRIRYMVKAMECKWIFLDHISIVISGLSDGDERRLIDNIMTNLRTLVDELKVGIVAVCHLNREGKLRGSAGIEQLSDMVIGLERVSSEDAHVDDIENTLVTIYKNRFSGETGFGGVLKYNPVNGKLETASMMEEY